MSTDQLILYGDAFWISPYVFSSFVALKEKGLSFTVKQIALHEKEQKKPEYVSKSITGRVPTLQDGSFGLAESSAICEYLEEKYPPPKYPQLLPQHNTEHRARARQIMAWLRSDLMPLREERPTTTMFYEKATTALTPHGQDSTTKLLTVADTLIPKDSGNLFGEWSLVDAELTFMLQRLILNGHVIPDKILKYAQAQWKRPSVQEYVNQTRKPYIAY